MTTICLSMIVRDEESVMARCLAPVLDFVTSYKIVDTGSSDNTVPTILEIMHSAGISGSIFTCSWKDDFSFHRNQAMPNPGECDYVLSMDADDFAVVGNGFDPSLLTAPCYSLANVHGGMANFRPQLFKPGIGVKWVGVRHEDLEGFDVTVPLDPKLLRMQITHDGARSKNTNKYIDDAIAILKDQATLIDGTSLKTRCEFLLGQSYFDAGVYYQARKCYRRYISLGGNNHKESISISYMIIAMCNMLLGYGPSIVVNGFMDAISYDPERIEPYFMLTDYLVKRGDLSAARGILEMSMKVEPKLHLIRDMGIWWNKREPYLMAINQEIASREVK